MTKTNNGTYIVKTDRISTLGKEVALTRRTTTKGRVRYGVVIEDRHGFHQLVKSYTTVLEAWNTYKGIRALG